MKIHTGLTDEARLGVGSILNRLLADESVLYATTRDYHWNVTGPSFMSLHLEFESQYEQLARSIDGVAERARSIGVEAKGAWSALAREARISAKAGSGLAGDQMVLELLALHEGIIVQLRSDSEACGEEFRDAGTADFLTGLMEQHEKTAWMLRAQIEDKNA